MTLSWVHGILHALLEVTSNYFCHSVARKSVGAFSFVESEEISIFALFQALTRAEAMVLLWVGNVQTVAYRSLSCDHSGSVEGSHLQPLHAVFPVLLLSEAAL